ncbi:DUF4369 domain-containing protein [Roseivirga sp.]|uniref:DUF4369 domain-containing protein n=1 Tax=Roseivirga sp. TaxID=1964215 RepID=UPI003B5256BB
MNKNKLYLLLLPFIIGCSQSPEYLIKGTIENYEGYIFLRYNDFVDSTLVQNGTFEFTGEVDHVVQATLTNQSDGAYFAPFYLGNEEVQLTASFQNSRLGMVEAKSPSNLLMAKILSDLEAIMEDEERLRSNEMFLYIDSIAHLYPRNEFVGELTSEVVTSDFITIQQSNQLLQTIDTLLMDPTDLKSVRTALSRMERLNPGDQFPSFSFTGFNSEIYTIESFPNQYLLIDVWATWCGPCLKGFQELVPIYEELDGQLEVLAVSINPTQDRALEYLSKQNFPWKQAHAEGEFDNEFLQQLGVVFLPFYYLISPEGEILAINPSVDEIPELIKNRGSLKGVLR